MLLPITALKGLAPRSGQAVSPDWLKFKNPEAPAAKPERKRTGAGRGLKSRLANDLQYLFAQNIGIAFTGFDTLDDLRGDGLSYVIAAVSDSQREADSLECKTETRLVSGSKRAPLR